MRKASAVSGSVLGDLEVVAKGSGWSWTLSGKSLPAIFHDKRAKIRSTFSHRLIPHQHNTEHLGQSSGLVDIRLHNQDPPHENINTATVTDLDPSYWVLQGPWHTAPWTHSSSHMYIYSIYIHLYLLIYWYKDIDIDIYWKTVHVYLFTDSSADIKGQLLISIISYLNVYSNDVWFCTPTCSCLVFHCVPTLNKFFYSLNMA